MCIKTFFDRIFGTSLMYRYLMRIFLYDMLLFIRFEFYMEYKNFTYLIHQLTIKSHSFFNKIKIYSNYFIGRLILSFFLLKILKCIL
jgi:hypothetical protein